MRHLLIPFLFFLVTFAQISQATILSGIVRDSEGKALPYASVFIEGTSMGTNTNVEGEYSLELKAGTYSIVFQYVGYQQITKLVEITENNITLDVVLPYLDVQTTEVVVKAGEDPAYPIIREAIKKRKYYLEQINAYSCDSYVKGVQKLENLPEKILGRSLAQLRKGLDSSGNGIIYLSESISKMYFNEKKYKEVMISSKVSGDDNGFSFNSGVAMKNFNFYENQLTLGESKLLSPIAQTALLVYKYRLVGTFVDKGKIISKIEVIPKNPLDALFHGFIYIINDDWSIHSTELKTTGQAANISLLDTVEFRQIHIEIQDTVRKLFSQDIDFKLNVFGVKIFGKFVAVFRNYVLNPDFQKKFFDAEVFKVNEESNKKEKQYWDSVRPMPLTSEEEREYFVKDSLQKIWKTKAFNDSLDKKSNKPSIGMLLNGYTYRNRYQRWRLSIPSPLYTIGFNTVQGFFGNIEMEFTKSFDEDRTRWLEAKTQVQYGFSDKKWRGLGRVEYKFNDIVDAVLKVEGGYKVQQFNSQDPVNPFVNTLYSLFLRENFIKLYEKKYAEIQYSQRFLKNFYAQLNISYQERSPLTNSSDYSFFYRDKRTYFSNVPFDFSNPVLSDIPFFDSHRHFAIDFYLRIRFAQKYVSYPKRRFYLDNDYPEIWINYKKGIPALGAVTDYDYLSITVQKEDLAIGTLGYLTLRAKYGVFLNRRCVEFPDFIHFTGNQTVYAKSDFHWRSYQLLPYYSYSTDKWFVEAHLEHDLKGLIWNKLPLLKKLGFENVIGYHFLYNPDNAQYMEFNFAISRIGWKLLRFGRVDFVWGMKSDFVPKFGVVFSLNFSL